MQSCLIELRHLEIIHVILSAAKDLTRRTPRSFAALRACPERSEGMTCRTQLEVAHGRSSLQMSNEGGKAWKFVPIYGIYMFALLHPLFSFARSRYFLFEGVIKE